MAPTPTGPASPPARTVALVTLGCARNDVDSEELAGRLAAAGWELVADAAQADVAVVNTCGFVDQAKKDSIDAILEAADLRQDETARTRAVVAVGCLAERYGAELASSLPEADAVLGFDSYPELAAQLDEVLRGHAPRPHVPVDRRTLLPISPVDRQRSVPPVAGTGPVIGTGSVIGAGSVIGPGTTYGPPVVRHRLADAPWAPLKLASGCDRRCTFCAIPSFRGAFVSRGPQEVLAEAHWLAGQGVRELFLVSENSTSYGKDLGDLRLLESLLPRLVAVEGIDRVRVSYLQPAEVRPGLIEAIATTPGVAPYFDLSFQHCARDVLRRMRRFGGIDEFLTLIEKIRSIAPEAGIRSNVIVGFPGESEADLKELESFLSTAMLDVVGVFGYSDEDGTEAADLDGKLDADEIADRVTRVGMLVEELTGQRAADRIDDLVEVIVDEIDDEDGLPVGRAAHQGPEVDGTTRLVSIADGDWGVTGRMPVPGELVSARVIASEGVDLVAVVEGHRADTGEPTG